MQVEDKIIVANGDIFLTRGHGSLSKGIRYFTKEIGESRTKVNHCGLVVQYGPLETAVIVEALTKVKMHELWSRYGPESETDIMIFRPVNLPLFDIDKIVFTAMKQVGKTYGYTKVVAHFLDWCLLGAYCFRRIADSPNYPICSWLVAHAFASVGKSFGVELGKATPDDIYDYCMANPDKYVMKRPLMPIMG